MNLFFIFKYIYVHIKKHASIVVRHTYIHILFHLIFQQMANGVRTRSLCTNRTGNDLMKKKNLYKNKKQNEQTNNNFQFKQYFVINTINYM